MSGAGGALPGQAAPPRQRLPFRAVNRRDRPGHEPGLQRHHILPRQLLGRACFAPMLAQLGPERLAFDDFRRNGLLLPANDRTALAIGLPLHRGPHRTYNELVFERVGGIEAGWAALRLRAPDVALRQALHDLERLQGQLRGELLDQRKRLRLNRRDPLGAGVDFTQLDAMADLLWPATGPQDAG